MTDSRSNSEADDSDHAVHDDEIVEPPYPGIQELFQQRQISTGPDQVTESSETTHEQNAQTPITCDNRFFEEKDEDVTFSDDKPYCTSPPMSENSSEECHPTLSLIGGNQEPCPERSVDDIAPVPMSHCIYFAKGTGGGYSSNCEGPFSMGLVGEDQAPLPISQLFDAKMSNTLKNATDIQAHGSMNSSISLIDEFALFVTGQSVSVDACTPNNRTNNNTSESLNVEPYTTAELTHNQHDNTPLDSDGHESMPAQNIDICLPTQPAFIEAEIIIPEAFLVPNDAYELEVLSDEFTDSQIPSAHVVLSARYSLIIAGTNVRFGALAAVFILTSLVIGLAVGVTLNHKGSIPLRIQIISNGSAEISIKHDIERNVLWRNTTF
ncbi:hypothetical protein ACHAWX_001434 [Stephanocyclus meneghinianus]